ncbi:MAG: cytochrome c oxidase subunit II [Gemmatimonadaceae bacterium]
MFRHPRSRRIASAALGAALCVASACTRGAPNTTLTPHSEFGRDIDRLWDILLIGGATVFVLVELGLLYTVFRYRHREGNPEPKQVHGNTTLEITWTLIPAVVLAFIAVPTIRTIFNTQAKAAANALEVEVVGHQWWWEFRYPQLGVTTANELYLPVGRTASFALKTKDVLHSFWIPQLAGKRDLISNHTNYLWFTPESTFVWNGFCAEYCGPSHANMRFKVFTVTQPEFDAWVAHQKTGPAFGGTTAAVSDTAAARPSAVAAVATSTNTTSPARGSAGPITATPVFAADLAAFPRARLPRHVIPATPTPITLGLAPVTGNPTRGAQLYRTGACIGCHVVEGVSASPIGPNLTHVGSRTSIAAGLYPNDPRHLALWIKNAPLMKPGSLMPALGKSAQVPGGYTDQQIVDIAAYLLSLK